MGINDKNNDEKRTGFRAFFVDFVRGAHLRFELTVEIRSTTDCVLRSV